jgi:hypothetical protein
MKQIRAICVSAAVLSASLVFAPLAGGQVIVEQPREGVPVLVTVFPLALERGATVELAIAGERLEGVSGVLCEGLELVEVISAEAKSAKLRVKTAPDAPPGIYPLHLLCTAGLSNPRMIVVDDIPQIAEVEANDSPEQANALNLPCSAIGVLAANDRDYFRFQAAEGETLLFDLRAARIGSPLQGVLTLFDARGQELRKAAVPPHDIAPDMRLEHTFPDAGEYLVCVHEQTFQGADFAGYQLRIAPALHAEAMYPLGGRRGETVEVELTGGNLERTVVHSVDLSSLVDWATARLEIPTENGLVTAPALFAVGEHPEYHEQESNGDDQHAEAVDVPVTINGRFQTEGDRDCFRFRAATGEKVILELFAERLGTPLDALLVVRDSAGRQIGEADDTTVAERLPPVIRSAADAGMTDDPRLEITAPADGDYVVEVSDRFGHGGAALAYRLEICKTQQDFELIVQPGRVDSPDPNNRRRNRARQVVQQFDGRGGGALSIDRGGRGSLVVRAIRRGYQGPIKLSAAGLPPGLLMQPATILTGQNQALVDFLADFDADSAAGFVRVTGTAEIEGRTQVRRARQPVVFSGLPLGAVAQQDLQIVAIGVSGRGAELALRGQLAGAVTPGGTARVRVELRRREGIKGAVSLKAVSLPSGLSFEPVTIEETQTEAEVSLLVAADTTPGKRSIQLEGQLNTKEKDRQEPLAAFASIEIDVRPLLTVELLTQTLELAPGGTAKLAFRVERNDSQPLPVSLDVSRLPEGVTLAETTIPADATQFELLLSAAADARPSPLPRIVQFKPIVQLKPIVQTSDSRLELPTQRVVIKIVKP